MAIGKRIEEMLGRLKWQRSDLMARVPTLTAQALSNLIRRDSARSEWDEQIADALGVSVLWLVYGKDASYPKTQKVTDLKTREPDTIDRAAAIMATMSRDGQLVAIGRLMELAQQYPRAKTKPFQLLIFPELGAAARLRHNSSHDN